MSEKEQLSLGIKDDKTPKSVSDYKFEPIRRGRGACPPLACPPLASLKSLFNNSQRVFKFLLLLNGAERKTQE